MEILNFIFGLGIAFSIFGFLWGLFMLLLNFITNQLNIDFKPISFLVLKVLRYTLLSSVVANYILNYQESGVPGSVTVANMILGVVVMALYFMGKMQNTSMISQFSQHKLVSLLMPKLDPKIDGYIFSGAIVYFIFCLQFPMMVDNGVVNWFTLSINNVYESAFLGWIFSAIAFFFLVNILIRAANVIGSLVTGQPINKPKSGGIKFGGGQMGSNPFEQFREQQQSDDGFVDYEDVTDAEDVTDGDDRKLD